MIGALRFSLAILVVFNHLWLPTANKVGAHAVAAFYIISGFLMAKVIQETYGLSLAGGARFVLNRLLRLFPLYWAVLGVSVVLLFVFPGTFGSTYSNMKVPDSAWHWWQNLFLLDLASSPQVVAPPAWSLSVELFFYGAMVLLLARSKWISLAWLVASLSYTVYLIAIGATFSQRYTPVTAASLFFATGACLYFFGRNWRPPVGLGLALLPLFLAFPLIVEAAGGDRLMLGFYGPAILFVIIFTALLPYRNEKLKGIDAKLGDLAYPVFLIHFMAAGIIETALTFLPSYRTTWFVFATALTILLSVGWVRLEHRWLTPLRNDVRSSPHGTVPTTMVRADV